MKDRGPTRPCQERIYTGPHEGEICGRRARYQIRPPYAMDRGVFYVCGIHALAWLDKAKRAL